MPINAALIGASAGARQPRDLTPGINSLALAFRQGAITADEILDGLVKPSRRKAERARNLAEVELTPLATEAKRGELEGDIAQQPQKARLADLTLQGQIAQAEQGLAIQPKQFKLQQIQTEQDVADAIGLAGARPFASSEDAVAFFEATHPGEKIPEDRAKLTETNRATFNAIQKWKRDLRGFGEAKTETFEEIDPNTFDKRRVRVMFDVNGNEIRRDVLGITQTGEKSLTEKQANSLQFATRMALNEAFLKSLESGGFDPSTLTNYAGQTASRHKLGGLATPEQQQYEAAKRNWIAAVLRQESGAAIANSEYKGADHQYFPQPGDTAETMEQKRQIRDVAFQNMRRAATLGLSPAQVADMDQDLQNPQLPDKMVADNPILPDAEVKAARDKAEAAAAKLGVQPPAPAAAPTEAPITPEAPSANVVQVQTPDEARALPANVEFFRTPDGRIKVNPNFRP